MVTCWERFSDPVVVWEANRAGRGVKVMGMVQKSGKIIESLKGKKDQI